MKYYVIKPKPHINGISKAGFSDELWSHNPQLFEFIRGENSYNYAKRVLPAFDFELNPMELENKAKVTDFISGAPSNTFFVSEKTKEIIQEYVLPQHKFYKVTFIKKDSKSMTASIVEGYWWLYFNLELGGNINFEETILDYQQHAYDSRLNKAVAEIKTYKDYKVAVEKSKRGIRAKKLVMNKSFNVDLDIWATQYLKFETFFSERIIKRFEDEKLTGFDVLSTINIFI